MNKVEMVDLKSQYLHIKDEIDSEIQGVLNSTRFIGGPLVSKFADDLKSYLDVNHVIPCANGTDALQIALMALDLEPGDEVIVPSFTYVATAEVIGLLNLKPVMIDVEYDSFNINRSLVEEAITPKTKVIIVVHLFGQSTDMEGILDLAKDKELIVIEDNAQAIGAEYSYANGQKKKTGCMGHIGTTSFFPSKNLGCYGDGGAMFTNDEEIAQRLKMISNHGQKKKYYHSVIGCNSRLDAIQAAILGVKLKYLDNYSTKRNEVANKYDLAFKNITRIKTPTRSEYSNHVFHQYTIKVLDDRRDELKNYLLEKNISSMIYYPVPLYSQEAFSSLTNVTSLPVTERLCKEVLSLPIHTEMEEQVQDYIIESLCNFFENE